LLRLRLMMLLGGEAMQEEYSENGRNGGDAPRSRKEGLFAEGMAMAVAIGKLAALTFLCFRR
jgi:hypothetical protein